MRCPASEGRFRCELDARHVGEHVGHTKSGGRVVWGDDFLNNECTSRFKAVSGTIYTCQLEADHAGQHLREHKRGKWIQKWRTEEAMPDTVIVMVPRQPTRRS